MPSEESFRTGDQAEYLTQYLMSSFGMSVQIPRQEDQGFDFHCTLDSSKKGELPDFRNAFYLQVKVGKPREISLGGLTKGRRWRRSQVQWLFDLDIPLLLGFADIEENALKVYNTSAKWLLYYEIVGKPLPFKIWLAPSGSQPQIPISNKARGRGVVANQGHDGKNWRVYLGEPIAEIKLAEIGDDSKVNKIKHRLIEYLKLERKSLSHRVLGTQWAYWVSQIDWDKKPFQTAWVIEHTNFPDSNSGAFYEEFAPYISSLIFRLSAAGQKTALREAVRLFRTLEPRLKIPPELRVLLEAKFIP